MSKINVLDSSVFNLISAGEVVERPSSVVKELVENCIDADASKIKIEIEGGGIKKIKITDNGGGIEKQFLKTAFLPHATSKISSADDLEAITSLGFRGEALASIAAVSIINVKTKLSGDDVGAELDIKGGVFGELKDCATADGTSITVQNLFFNTPARVKFLKRAKTEEGYVSDVIEKQVFSNPYICFEYFIDGKQIFKTQGKGLFDAVKTLYNAEITSNLFEIENTSGNFRISGLISKPTYYRPNRGYQVAMVNGRAVENKTILQAIEKAYSDFTLKRMYPMFVVNIIVPYDFVDVNVHPSKTDVRFQDSGAVFGFLFKSVFQAVDSFSEIKSLDQAAASTVLDDVSNTDDGDKAFCEPIYKDNIIVNNPNNNKEESKLSGGLNLSSIFSRNFSHSQQPASLKSDSGISFNMFAKAAEIKTEDDLNVVDENLQKQNGLFGDEFGVKVIGQLFKTYIIVEKGEEVYFIDQHAVHERLLYDKLVEKASIKAQQPMLAPYILNLNHKETEFFEGILPSLSDIGFDIDAFGSLSYKVSAVPAVLSNIDLKKFFDDVLSDLTSNFKVNKLEILKDKLAQTACKAAIKAGDKLSELQIKQILSDIDGQQKIPLQCPHGRPAIIKFSRAEIDKWFKRIV